MAPLKKMVEDKTAHLYSVNDTINYNLWILSISAEQLQTNHESVNIVKSNGLGTNFIVYSLVWNLQLYKNRVRCNIKAIFFFSLSYATINSYQFLWNICSGAQTYPVDNHRIPGLSYNLYMTQEEFKKAFGISRMPLVLYCSSKIFHSCCLHIEMITAKKKMHSNSCFFIPQSPHPIIAVQNLPRVGLFT